SKGGCRASRVCGGAALGDLYGRGVARCTCEDCGWGRGGGGFARGDFFHEFFFDSAGGRRREVAGWANSHRGRGRVSKIVRASCAGTGAFCSSLYADPLLPDAGEESYALFLSGARDDDGLRGCSSAVPARKKSSGVSDVHETVARGV